MNSEILQQRTKKFALNSIKFFQMLPKSDESRILGKQLLRSSTSVASNYRAACRGRSKQEFYAKICIVVEESDESLFWLELIQESGIQNNESNTLLTKEAEKLLFIFHPAKNQPENISINKSINQ
jgi:four helix bundle protein